MPASADESVEKVTVTGTRIPQKGLKSVSPITTVTSTESRVQGTTSSETLLNSLPQVSPNQGQEVSNGSSGTATVDLRGLGPQRTLVLINGRRMNPASAGQPTPDLNNIPVGMVERIEVLTGGASAVYGADAVAGVVNFIMRKNFEGVEVGVQYGFANHDNDDARLLGLIADSAAGNPNEFKTPNNTVNDGRIVQVYGIMGANSADDKGNVTLYAQYRNAQPILQSDRDFSACSISTLPPFARGSQVCQGSSNSAFGRFVSLDNGSGPFIASPTGDMNLPYSGAYAFNFAPYNYLQRPDDRYVLGALGRYELAADTELYAELQFSDDRTVAQIAPSGLFRGSGLARGNYLINCDNPFMDTGNPDSPLDVFCGGDPLGAGNVNNPGQALLDIGRRFTEAGPRQDDFRHESFRTVLGLKGALADTGWNYDIYAQYGQTVQSRTYLNDVSLSRIAKSLQVVLDPRAAEPTFNTPQCVSFINGSDVNCLPFNIFQTGSLNDALLNYLVTPGFQIGTTQEWVVSGAIDGDLGVTIPWAESPVTAAVGAEYRQEKLEHRVDLAFSTGDLAGQGGPTPSVAGSFDVVEVFGEIAVPVIENQPGFHLLQFEGGYRLSDYENAGITHTYKYGGSWMPVEDLRMRGTFQRAVRAPNIVELFTPTYIGLWGGQDPCAATTSSGPAFNATQCANLGLTPTQITQFATSPNFSCPSAQCSAQYSGNANLRPEESDTKSFGFVFTPTFLKGFTTSVDYYDIFVDGIIGVIPQRIILQICAADPLDPVCTRIQREPTTGILFGNAGFIESRNENLGSTATTGVDIETNYKFNLDETSTVVFNLQGTWIDTYEVEPLPGAAIYDCAGLFGTTCGTPIPDWRHKLRVTWSAPWDVDFSVAWRHVGSVSFDGNESDPSLTNGFFDTADASIPASDYFDFSFDWSVSDNIKMTGGINNFLDRTPTVLDSNILGISSPPFGNANTYPVIYDSLGREVFIGMTTRF